MSQDIVVIGSNLSALIAAHRLADLGHSVIVLEESSSLQVFQEEEREGFSIDRELFYFTREETLEALETQLHLNIPVQKKERIPLKFNQGKFERFHERLSESHQALVPTENRKTIKEHILKGIENTHFKMRYGAKTFKVEIENKKVKGVILETGEMINCSKLIWALPLTHILKMLDRSELNPAWFTSLSTHSSYTTLNLDFALRAPITDIEDPIHIQLVQKDESQGYLVGQFPSNQDESMAPSGKQLSTWSCPITEEELEDNQLIARKMRHIKRLIKKAFPKFFDRVLWERISLTEWNRPHGSLINFNQLGLTTQTPIKGLYLAGDSVLPEDKKEQFSEEDSPLTAHDLEILSALDAANQIHHEQPN